MKKNNNIAQFIQRKEGTTAIEYGIIGALISIAAIVSMMMMGEERAAMFEEVADTYSKARADSSG